MNIYLTRHGQTQWNLEGRVQGFLDSPLTNKGIEDAKKLGQRLKEIDFDYVFSSTSNRAYDTAKNIIGNKENEIIQDENIREINVGTWEGLLYEEIKSNYGADFKIYREDPEKYISKNRGEDYKSLEKRVKDFVSKLKDLDGENILIVSHGLTSLMLLNVFEQRPIGEIRNRKIHAGTSLSLIEYQDGQFRIVYEGDESHLK